MSIIADRLKGITVEIGGDTNGLNKALKQVNSESRELQGELSQVERLLKFNPDNVELLAQRQTLLNRQVETTTRKLNQLKEAEAHVRAELERGNIGEEQFRAFQREIIATEGRLRHFENQAQETGQRAEHSFKEMGGGIANAIAGAAAGAGIGEVVSKSLEAAHLETQISVGFDVPEDSIGKVKEIVTSIQSYGVEGEAALEGVRKQFALNTDLTVAQNQKIIESAAVISQSYADLDFTELIQESNEFAEAIGLGQQDALNMTNALLKMGFPPDQLDIMTEYGSQLHRAGYNAQEIQGIFAAGVETKSWNIDVLLDGVKEGRIRLAEFGTGVDKTTKSLIDGTNISAKQLQDWGAAVAEGGDAGKIAFAEVATQLGKVKDDTQRNAIGTRLFGTLWEEQGAKITDALGGANTKTGDLVKNQNQLNDAVSKMNNDPQVKLNQALTDMNNALAPLLTQVADFIGKVAEWVSANPQIAAGIVAVTVAIGILIGVFMVLMPVLGGLATAAGALNIAMLPMTLTVLAWIAVIGALIAIGILVYKNWHKIAAEAKKSWGEIKDIVIGAGKRIAKEWKKATDDVKSAWTAVVKKFSDIGHNIKREWDKAIGDIKSAFGKLKSWFKGIDLKQIGINAITSLRDGMQAAWKKVKEKAQDIAATVKQAIKDKLKIGSPSKVMMELGYWTGEGLAIGLQNSVKKITGATMEMTRAITSSVTQRSEHGAMKKYFDMIRKTGQYDEKHNKYLKQIPAEFRAQVLAMGKTLAPKLKGTKVTKDSVFTKGNTITVNLNSPKALSVKDANKQFSRTMNKMSLMW